MPDFSAHTVAEFARLFPAAAGWVEVAPGVAVVILRVWAISIERSSFVSIMGGNESNRPRGHSLHSTMPDGQLCGIIQKRADAA